MKIQVFPIDLLGQAPCFTPKDKHLHNLAVEFMRANLQPDKEGRFPSIGDFAKIWVAAEVQDGVPVKVTAIGGIVQKVDVPLLRFLDSKSGKKLLERMNDYVCDLGYRGTEALVYISSTELPEQRCPAQADWLKAMGAVPADRWSYIIR